MALHTSLLGRGGIAERVERIEKVLVGNGTGMRERLDAHLKETTELIPRFLQTEGVLYGTKDEKGLISKVNEHLESHAKISRTMLGMTTGVAVGASTLIMEVLKRLGLLG